MVCAIEVAGLPAVVRSSGDYQLHVGSQPGVALPGAGIAYVALTQRARVSLGGPAYEGHVDIDPADCGGEQIHTITSRLRPARLRFAAGAVDPSELIVSCVRGCPYQNRTADSFPELPFPRDELQLVVELELKANGHRAERREFRLSPGDNELRVTLRRLW